MNMNENSSSSARAPAILRRGFISGIAVAAAVALPVSSFADITTVNVRRETENPELAIAYERLISARTEHAKAKEALEWIADEWRHLWPLAPECILGHVFADRSDNNQAAERDIIGNYIYRDTDVLTTRLPKKVRQEHPRLCFSIETAERLQKHADFWETARVRGKTDANRARSLAENERLFKRYREAVTAAIQYERETAELRERAGVPDALARVEAARKAVVSAEQAILGTEIKTITGLKIKAEILMMSLPTFFTGKVLEEFGALGGLFRIVQDAIVVGNLQEAA